MDKLQKIADSLSKVNIPEFVMDALRLPKVREEIPDIIRDRLYYTGKDSLGKELRTNSAISQGNRSYAGFTYQRKKEKGQRASNVTLRDTGRFYRSINAQVPFQSLKISADFATIYENFTATYPTEKEFQDAILGLGHEEIEQLNNEYILPTINARIKRMINV